MQSTFNGFSEEDLKNLNTANHIPDSSPSINSKKMEKIGAKHKRNVQYKLPQIKSDVLNDTIDDISFEKCKLSLKRSSVSSANNNKNELINPQNTVIIEPDCSENANANDQKPQPDEKPTHLDQTNEDITRKIKCNNYNEDEMAAHKVKLENLQLKQKLMEEQNKKRKEMLAKALADRAKQTEEEVMKIEKIKKEFQVLDGQFTQDVSVLRKKIDQACHTYSEAEKHYLRIEKEFLQAKLSLQKEKERKELLTEHLCTLITHNETRKAQKLETLMLQLAYDSKPTSMADENENVPNDLLTTVDGVDERTGKIIELNSN